MVGVNVIKILEKLLINNTRPCIKGNTICYFHKAMCETVSADAPTYISHFVCQIVHGVFVVHSFMISSQCCRNSDLL